MTGPKSSPKNNSDSIQSCMFVIASYSSAGPVVDGHQNLPFLKDWQYTTRTVHVSDSEIRFYPKLCHTYQLAQ